MASLSGFYEAKNLPPDGVLFYPSNAAIAAIDPTIAMDAITFVVVDFI